MRLAESFYGQTSTRQKSGARGLCVQMKNIVIAALIAMTATSAMADTSTPDQKAAIFCVHEYYDGRSDVNLTTLGEKLIENAASLYNISDSYVRLGDDEEAEHVRQEARDQVKEYFGKHAGEINYCFRQHMGE